jgi:hypothetical protein
LNPLRSLAVAIDRIGCLAIRTKNSFIHHRKQRYDVQQKNYTTIARMSAARNSSSNYRKRSRIFSRTVLATTPLSRFSSKGAGPIGILS